MRNKLIIVLFLFSLIVIGCAPKPAQEMVLLKDSVKLKFDKYPHYVGAVKNLGRKNLQLRSVAFTIWRDGKRGYIKDSGIAWVVKNVEPDQTATFEVGFPDLTNKDDLSVYTCEIRWFDRKRNKIFYRSEDS